MRTYLRTLDYMELLGTISLGLVAKGTLAPSLAGSVSSQHLNKI
jgi:hypothetical protein